MFSDAEVIADLGLVNAYFVSDRHHLKCNGLLKMFEKVVSKMLKGLLHQMVKAMSKEAFNEALSMTGDLLTTVTFCSGKSELDLAIFAGLRETYSTYCIQKIPGNCGRIGNQASDTNHLSVLCFFE